MAPGLHFAGAPDIRCVDAKALERVAAGYDLVIGEDRAKLEWKCVE